MPNPESNSFLRLTERRLRIHGQLLALCLWAVYAVNLSGPGLRDRSGLIKGADFLYFYTFGKVAVLRQSALLYDMQGLAVLMRRLVPEAGSYVYASLYGPQVSLFFAPLAELPYGVALIIWLCLNTAIYGLCCFAVWRYCLNLQNHARLVIILAAAFPGFFHLMAWGQSSGLALLCFTGAYLALKHQKFFLAGVAVGCLIFKPQLGIAAAVAFVVSRQWKVVMGAVVAASAQLAIGWLYFGTQAMEQYFQALLHVRQIMPLLEPRPYQMHSMRAFWELLIPFPTAAFLLYVAASVVILVLMARCWLRPSALELRFSALLVATVLVAPHLTVYDLVILAPAFLFMADEAVARSSNSIGWLIYACYFLFLLGPLAKITHVQLSVPAMTTLLWICSRCENWRFNSPPATLVTS